MWERGLSYTASQSSSSGNELRKGREHGGDGTTICICLRGFGLRNDHCGGCHNVLFNSLVNRVDVCADSSDYPISENIDGGVRSAIQGSWFREKLSHLRISSRYRENSITVVVKIVEKVNNCCGEYREGFKPLVRERERVRTSLKLSVKQVTAEKRISREGDFTEGIDVGGEAVANKKVEETVNIVFVVAEGPGARRDFIRPVFNYDSLVGGRRGLSG